MTDAAATPRGPVRRKTSRRREAGQEPVWPPSARVTRWSGRAQGEGFPLGLRDPLEWAGAERKKDPQEITE